MNDFSIGTAFDTLEDCLAYAVDNGITTQKDGESIMQHSYLTAYCAEAISSKIPELDTQTAYALGLLHDAGKFIAKESDGYFHGLEGYHYFMAAGWDLVAEVCLSHTFLDKDFTEEEYIGYGKDNLTKAKELLKYIKENDYSKLIRLSDLLVNVYRHGTLKERMIFIKNKYKIKTEVLKKKYKSAMKLKQYFDAKCGCDIYDLLGVK